MTTTDRPVTTFATPAEMQEPIFLICKEYKLTAREVLYTLGSYLANFGDHFGTGGLNPLAAIDEEVLYTGNIRIWQDGRNSAEVEEILARAQQVVDEFFGPNFPHVDW